jgi:hypothetical protein
VLFFGFVLNWRGCEVMKLAWLCYLHDEDDLLPIIRFEEPERWIYRKVVPIVYAILVDRG